MDISRFLPYSDYISFCESVGLFQPCQLCITTLLLLLPHDSSNHFLLQDESILPIHSYQHIPNPSNPHPHSHPNEHDQKCQSTPYPVRVAVMGGGNFGLALATVVARKSIPTMLLVRDEDIVQRLNTEHKHPRYMSDITLPKLIRATSDPERALPDATYIIHTVPCQFRRE